MREKACGRVRPDLCPHWNGKASSSGPRAQRVRSRGPTPPRARAARRYARPYVCPMCAHRFPEAVGTHRAHIGARRGARRPCARRRGPAAAHTLHPPAEVLSGGGPARRTHWCAARGVRQFLTLAETTRVRPVCSRPRILPTVRTRVKTVCSRPRILPSVRTRVETVCCHEFRRSPAFPDPRILRHFPQLRHCPAFSREPGSLGIPGKCLDSPDIPPRGQDSPEIVSRRRASQI